MSGPKVKIEYKGRGQGGTVPFGEFPVVLDTIPAQWSLKSGVQPASHILQVRAKDLVFLDATGYPGPYTLHWTIETGQQISFEGLYITRLLPGPNRNILGLQVEDRRWLLHRKRIVRRFNMRRRVGTRRGVSLVEDGPIELERLTDSLSYANYSLYNSEDGTKWTAEECLRSVLLEVDKFEREETGFTLGQRPIFFDLELEQDRFVPIENLEIDDRADLALSRILSFIPGAQISVTPGGAWRVYQKASLTEPGAHRRPGEYSIPSRTIPPPRDDTKPDPTVEMEGRGHAELFSKERARPRSIKVYFTIEAEVRFDFSEQSGITVVNLDEQQKADQRWLDNVVPIPDFSLTVTDANGDSRLEQQGTYITLDDALRSWGDSPLGEPISHELIRVCLMPYLDLFAGLSLSGRLDPNADWASRVSALQQHYRRTFRIPQRWLDNMFAMRAYRVATIDRVTGIRAPAQAFQDYAIIATQRSMVGYPDDAERPWYALNISGYPAGGNIDKDTKAIPATVNVLDPEQGILQIQFEPDPARVFDTFLPGRVETDSAATQDLVRANREGRPIAWNAVEPGTSIAKLPQLEDSHKMSTIVTLIPASPNSTKQLFMVEVKPDDIRAMLPKKVAESTRGPFLKGPSYEVRIPPQIETARVMWSDNAADRIASLFGFTKGPVVNGVTPDPPNIEDLVINSEVDAGPGPDRGAASLQAIARAEAARIYTMFADKTEGTFATAAKRAMHVEPTGNLEEVMFEIDPNGVTSVQMVMGEEPIEMPMLGFLDSGTRAIVMRLVRPGAL